MENMNLSIILSEIQKQNELLIQLNGKLQVLIEKHEQGNELMRLLLDRAADVVANTKPPATYEVVTGRKIYKQEVLTLLNISLRTYDRHKACGLLKPRGVGHDFYYPQDLEEATAEGKRRGRL